MALSFHLPILHLYFQPPPASSMFSMKAISDSKQPAFVSFTFASSFAAIWSDRSDGFHAQCGKFYQKVTAADVRI
ncbi:hypothetical protein T4A_6611 [Trichinella pseudospiralis]|uniref:Uncharacterized protein n=1 Tax=Trichinella pseudospiralis TaxID=6337 RepID=A0A0V1DW70_TRIPS|nr:hypothetical protein T4A_6611 [Trichinella pseudospiralis]